MATNERELIDSLVEDSDRVLPGEPVIAAVLEAWSGQRLEVSDAQKVIHVSLAAAGLPTTYAPELDERRAPWSISRFDPELSQPLLDDLRREHRDFPWRQLSTAAWRLLGFGVTAVVAVSDWLGGQELRPEGFTLAEALFDFQRHQDFPAG